eukprot:TRINITY_DN38906_c0_g1_i1.p2 TRINITY_DN38906_c0_g1~~TRINITY_DN38906_c0_g1_i1.p2  ORF type:complete len:134 (-),score=23.31 TRINITY_DN38906_c0_g1_i1:168-569(-)
MGRIRQQPNCTTMALTHRWMQSCSHHGGSPSWFVICRARMRQPMKSTAIIGQKPRLTLLAYKVFRNTMYFLENRSRATEAAQIKLCTKKNTEQRLSTPMVVVDSGGAFACPLNDEVTTESAAKERPPAKCCTK